MTVLRLYEPHELGSDGYPFAWHDIIDGRGEQASHRCVRCGHPYRNGEHGSGEWTPCDEWCTHAGPIRWKTGENGTGWFEVEQERENGSWPPGSMVQTHRLAVAPYPAGVVQARWRILTVHHLNGQKHDLRWWNLIACCQRCHLWLQGRVVLERVWPWEHDDYFKPYAAGWYAHAYLGENLTRDETLARLDELLALERIA